MSPSLSDRGRSFVSMILTMALVVAGLAASVALPQSAQAAVSPLLPRPSDIVTADSLPTAQMNGVAWDQEVVGGTVYVGGNFTQARPAGSAAGQNQTPRTHLMSYTLSTGVMTSWAPTLNGQVRTVVASPDGSRLYVGGDFTEVNGQARSRIAAFNTATGQLVPNFAPNVGYTVHDIAVSDTTVYVGGAYAGVGAQPRQNLAAFSVSNGALLSWAPSADRPVLAVELSEDGQYLLVGGHFENVNGVPTRGLAKLDAETGTLLPWPVLISNAGADSAVNSLTVRGGSVFGSGFHFGPGGNQEGPWRVNVESGALEWVADCHGDTYDTYPGPAGLYAASHAHYCGNTSLGAPQYNPWKFQHNMAWSLEATGKNIREVHGYTNWEGQPSPSILHWHPVMAIGSFTGMSQAAWTVEGNDDYTVVGGEFPRVNGGAQQGLARFAVRPIAPGNRGPQFHNNQLVPDLQPHGAGSVKVGWTAGWDMDDYELTYEIRRTPGGLVHSTTAGSNWWHTPGLAFVDTGLTPGQTYSYAIWVNDSDGNRVFGSSRSITAPAQVPRSDYAQAVLDAEPKLYWSLNDPVGSTTIADAAGGFHGVPGTAVTLGVANGAVSGDTAVSVNNNSNGRIHAFGSDVAPTEFSAQVWFRTSTASGRLLGFGDLQVGNSGHRDRQIYLTNSGRVHFGVRADGAQVLASTRQYNDNQWHQAVATLDGSTARLYVDGVLVAQRHDISNPEEYIGHWRLGGDSQSGWPSAGNANFTGSMDELSIYDYALTPAQVQAHYVASGRAATLPAPPTDTYGEAVFDKEPELYWRLSETSGNVAADAGWRLQPGSYQGGHTKAESGAIIENPNTAVRLNGSTGFITSTYQFTNPQTFSTEAWFKTTSTSGGKIIGFGNQQTSLSSNYDRHTYIQNDGRLVFGIYNGAEQRITSPLPYNDGEWHHVVSTLDSSGMRMYVDGELVGQNAANSAQVYNGHWRAGGDRVWSGASSNFLNGWLDEVAVYPRALNATEVGEHYVLGSGNHPNVAPVASFTYESDHLAVAFDASESTDEDGTIESYVWDFGDGHTGSGVAPSHVYDDSGSYTVTLTVTDDREGTDSVSEEVEVVANVAPSAEFSVLTNDLQASFDASGSEDTDGSIVSYAWDFGDGEAGSGVSAAHTYASAGTYVVTLTVTDDDGASTQVAQDVTVTDPPPNVPPVAMFVHEAQHLAVLVDASQSEDEDGQIVAYMWDFGDGESATGLTATHTYAEAGTYTITLTVTDDDGDNTSTSSDVTVTEPPANVAPVAAFTLAASDLTVAVDGADSYDPDGTIASYAWSFGDGGSAEGQQATHTYAEAGHYTVTLTVTDDDGESSSVTDEVTVVAPAANEPPTASFTTITSGLTLTVDASGSEDPDGVIEEYSWSFGDGESAAGAIVSHTYEAPGTYDVELTVTDDDGATDSRVVQVTVQSLPGENQPPTADFTAQVTGTNLTADASASSDPDGSIGTYVWDFGDGGTGTGVQTTHQYLASGSYTVTLTVVDDQGASDVTTRDVVVTGVPGAATYVTDTFSRSVTNGFGSADLGGPWSSSNPANSFQVAGGVGNVTTPTAGSGRLIGLPAVNAQDLDAVVDVAYDKPATGTGGFYGSLMVRRDGNTDYRLRVRPLPTNTMVILASNVAGSQQVLSSVTLPYVYQPGDVLRMRLQVEGTNPTTLRGKVWRVGEPEPSSWQVIGTNAAPALQGAGGVALESYIGGSVTNAPIVAMFDNLHVGSIGGEAINQAPVAAFTSVSDGLSVQFDGSSSSDADGTIASYSWSFGDGTSSSAAAPTHEYGAAGEYQVRLLVTDNQGASHSVTRLVQVTEDTTPEENVPPTASFTFEVAERTVTFDSSASSDPDGQIESWSWEFGDGNDSDVASPTHEYAADGLYEVSLTVTDDEGASHAVTRSVQVGDEPPAENLPPVASFTTVIEDLSVRFDPSGSTDQDGEVTGYEWSFGDGATSSEQEPTHTYDAAGEYEVSLTVTDDDGASGSVTEVIVVQETPAGPEVLIEDGFDRTLATGWGAAPTGSAWAIPGSSSHFWVDGDVGVIRMANPGSGPRVTMPGTVVLDSDTIVELALDKAPAGGDTYVTLASRQVGTSEYRLKVRFMPTQTMLILTQVVNGSESTLASSVVGGAYQVGQTYQVRFQVEGSGTTSLRAKAWLAGADEPSWQATASSTAAPLQTAGALGLQAYLASSASNAPVQARFGSIRVTAIPE